MHVKVNRLGKMIYDEGYRSLKDFVATNNIGCNYSAIYSWTTKKSTVFPQSIIYIDRIADALESSRIDVLNMISTDPSYDVSLIKSLNKSTKTKTKLQLLRETSDMSADDVAKLISTTEDIVDSQFVYDIENGKRRNFPSSSVMKNYMELFGLSFVLMHEYQDEACEKYLQKDKERRPVRMRESNSELAELRAEKGYRVADLCEIIGLDNNQYLTDIEHGRRRYFPSEGIEKKYLETLGLTKEKFLELRDKAIQKRREEYAVNIKTKESEDMQEIVMPDVTQEQVEEIKEAMNNVKLEVMAVEPTPKCKLPAEDMQTVMSLLYGKLDFATFKKVENILMGVE